MARGLLPLSSFVMTNAAAPTGLPVRRIGEYRILYDCHGSEVNPIGSYQFLQRDYLHHHKLLTPAIEEK